MKLIIQIPCYNEAETLPLTLADLPRSVAGFDRVEWLVVDDGSTDDTAQVAKESGADHIVRHTRNQGLARAFMTGIHESIRLGADVIVNTDADNQYCADDIPSLVRPILEGKADMVIGARAIDNIAHFSPAKKMLQKMGSWLVRKVSRTDVPDAASGFRAFCKDAACQISVFNNYTYTLETLIQAGQKNMAVTSVPVRVNPQSRPSRLIKNIPDYLIRSFITIIRIFIIYQPLLFFALIGAILFGTGFLLGLRFLYFFFMDLGSGHIQSLILASVLLGMGFQTILIAFIADLLASNRKILEEIRCHLKRPEMNNFFADKKGSNK
jgi:glycosyltransferase involved in cell wall biosynthesis